MEVAGAGDIALGRGGFQRPRQNRSPGPTTALTARFAMPAEILGQRGRDIGGEEGDLSVRDAVSQHHASPCKQWLAHALGRGRWLCPEGDRVCSTLSAAMPGQTPRNQATACSSLSPCVAGNVNDTSAKPTAATSIRATKNQ